MPPLNTNQLLIACFFVCSASIALLAITSANLLIMQPTDKILAAANTPSPKTPSQKEDKVGDCEQKYRACVKTAKSDVLREKCEADWRKCVSGQCKRSEIKTSSGLRQSCPRDADCQTSCTESATRKGDIISCCEGGPQHANKCKTKIGEDCYDNISAKEFADLTKKNTLDDPKTTPVEKTTPTPGGVEKERSTTLTEAEKAYNKCVIDRTCPYGEIRDIEQAFTNIDREQDWLKKNRPRGYKNLENKLFMEADKIRETNNLPRPETPQYVKELEKEISRMTMQLDEPLGTGPLLHKPPEYLKEESMNTLQTGWRNARLSENIEDRRNERSAFTNWWMGTMDGVFNWLDGFNRNR